MTFRVIL